MPSWFPGSKRSHQHRTSVRSANLTPATTPRPGFEILDPRLLLSGTITAEFVTVDNSAELTRYNTFDLQVTTTNDWTAAVLLLTLTQGTIYQDVAGTALATTPAAYIFAPSVEFDTALGGDAPSSSIAGAAGDLGGDAFQFDTAELDVSWFNIASTDTGTFTIARITLSDDAVGTWSYLTVNSATDSATDSGTITAGSLLPAPPPPPPPPPPPSIDGDFNIDGEIDVLWRNLNTGQTAIWQMNGTTFQASVALANATTDTNWRPVGIGDFTGDGETDTLWRNAADGRNFIAESSNGTISQQINITTVANLDWKVAGVADFTGDGKNDILWRNTRNGRNVVWEMDGTTFQQGIAVKRMKKLSWRIAGTADFNNDGKTDILWRNTANGRNAVWHLNGTTFQSSTAIKRVRNQAWQIAAVADYTGDGKADILWRNTTTGANTVWQMNGTAFQSNSAIQSQPDQDWQIAGPLLGLWEA